VGGAAAKTGEGGRSECKDEPRVANEYLTLPLITRSHTVVTKGQHYFIGYMIEKRGLMYGWLRVDGWMGGDETHNHF